MQQVPIPYYIRNAIGHSILSHRLIIFLYIFYLSLIISSY